MSEVISRSRGEAPSSPPALRPAGAEAWLLLRYTLKSPAALVIALVAGLVWPLIDVVFLFQTGTTPLAIALSLASVPIGPILWSIFGSRLAKADKREIPTSWPAPRVWRTLGTAAAIMGLGGAAALLGTGIALIGVEPGFWSPASFAVASLLDGFLMLFATIVLWTAVGVALGSITRGILNVLVPVLAPVAWLMGSAILSARDSASLLMPFLGLSTAAGPGASGLDAYGLGPFGSSYTWAAAVMAAGAVVALALSGLARHGRDSLVAILAILALGGTAVSAAGLTRAVPAKASWSATAYESGAKSPVTDPSVAISLDLTRAPELHAAARIAFRPQRRLTSLRFFLVPTLRISRVAVDGRRVAWHEGRSGWVSVRLPAPLAEERPASLGVVYGGIPMQIVSGSPFRLSFSFVGGAGWLLPPGMWYPLLGPTNPRTHFRLALKAPPGYLSLTPYGHVRGSTPSGAPLTGVGTTLQVVGGHLGYVTTVGAVRIFAASDQLGPARRAARQASSRYAKAPSCMADLLRPTPHGTVVWASPTGADLDPHLAPLHTDMSVAGFLTGSGISGVLPGRESYGDDAVMMGTTQLDLWYGSTRMESAPSLAAGVLGEGVATACGQILPGYMNEPDGSLAMKISRLPKPGLRELTLRAHGAYEKGDLTIPDLKDLVREVSNP